MAHFAKIDSNNLVEDIVFLDNSITYVYLHTDDKPQLLKLNKEV